MLDLGVNAFKLKESQESLLHGACLTEGGGGQSYCSQTRRQIEHSVHQYVVCLINNQNILLFFYRKFTANHMEPD